MSYILVAFLGTACGVFASWQMLLLVVAVVALAAGVAGAIHHLSLLQVVAQTVVLLFILEAAWLFSVLALNALLASGVRWALWVHGKVAPRSTTHGSESGD